MNIYNQKNQLKTERSKGFKQNSTKNTQKPLNKTIKDGEDSVNLSSILEKYNLTK